LTFWGTFIHEEFTKARKNQEAITKLPAWKQSLHELVVAREQGEAFFETYHPSREMTIEEMLIDMRLDGAREMWGVIVNGKTATSDQQIITPGDNVIFIPHPTGAAPIAIRDLVSELELIIISSLDDKRRKIGQFLTETQIEQIIDFWKDAEGPLYNGEVFNSENGPNKNVAHFALLRYILLSKLVVYDLVSGNNYADLYKVTGSMSNTLDALRAPSGSETYQFAPTTRGLALIHSKIKFELINKYEGQDLIDKMAEFKELFDLQYKIYGHSTKNSFYLDTLEVFYAWADLLARNEYGNIISKGDLSALSDFYGLQGKFATRLNKIRGYVNLNPEPEGNIENYLETFKEKIDLRVRNNLLDSDLAEKLYKELVLVSADYLRDTNIHYNNKRTLEGLALSRGIPTQNPKLDLLERISHILNIDNMLLEDLSEFLFDDKNYISKTFLTKHAIDYRPEIFTLEYIKSIVRSTTKFGLSKFTKAAVLMEVNKWVSENPFTIPYLKENSRFQTFKHGKNVHIKDYKVFESICRIYTIHEKSPSLSGANIKDLFTFAQTVNLPRTLRSGDRVLLISLLQEILEKTSEFKSLESDITVKEAYKREISIIEKYIIYRDDALKAYINRKFIASPRLQDLRKFFERDPGVKAFDVMTLLSRDLATEPIFFDNLEESIFNQAYTSFIRQHIDPKIFWSLYVSRMFLSTPKYHGVYPKIDGRGAITVIDQQVCLEGLHYLMEMGLNGFGHGKDGFITESDIIRVFTKLGGGNMYTMTDGRTVLQWWKEGSSSGVRQQKSFKERLQKFNDKIKFQRNNKDDLVKPFLKQFQKTAYDRFWDDATKEVNRYYLMSRVTSAKLSKFLSIPDSDLMRRIFPERMFLP